MLFIIWALVVILGSCLFAKMCKYADNRTITYFKERKELIKKGRKK